MRILCPPWVYRPQADTWLLARAVADATLPAHPRVLDVCTGTGALAVDAACRGAESVTAVDISRLAIATAWLNSRARRLPIELVRGDFTQTLSGREFDVVLANPPYVPCPERTARGVARAWHGGSDGRAVLDALCELLPAILAPGGVALIVHSSLCGEEQSLRTLTRAGIRTATVARQVIPFGPVLRQGSAWLESTGLIGPGQRSEELVVIRADRSDPSTADHISCLE